MTELFEPVQWNDVVGSDRDRELWRILLSEDVDRYDLLNQIMQDRLELLNLRALVRSLGVRVMHPPVDGAHQAVVEANCQNRTREQWDLVFGCEEEQ